MSKVANNIMRELSQLSLEDDLKQLESLDSENFHGQTLSLDDIKKLSLNINLLPSEYKSILFFSYCFNSKPTEINKILEIDNSVGKLRYTEKMLSNIMGLEKKWIDVESMKAACKLALDEYLKDYNNIEIKNKPNYSMDFRRKLRDISINRNIPSKLKFITKRVAIFILICLLSFSTFLAINSEARERVFNWIIETFPKFSIFTSDSSDELNEPIELGELQINYIPDEFELTDTFEDQEMLIYIYESKTQEQFDIMLVDASGAARSYYDTEDAEIEEIIIKESQGYTWERDGIRYLIWTQGGIEYHISGDLNLDEIIKIGENILK